MREHFRPHLLLFAVAAGEEGGQPGPVGRSNICKVILERVPGWLLSLSLSAWEWTLGGRSSLQSEVLRLRAVPLSRRGPSTM